MAITIVGTVVSTSSSTTSLSCNFHASTAVDDVLVALVFRNDELGVISVPTGWAEDGNAQLSATTGQDRRGTVLTKVATSADVSAGSVSIAHTDTAEEMTVHMVTVRGVDTAGIYDVTPASGHYSVPQSDTSPNINGLTTLTDGACVITFYGATHNDITAVTQPSGFTALDITTTLPGSSYNNRQAFSAYRIPDPAETVSGEWTTTASPPNVAECYLATIALKPAASGADVTATGAPSVPLITAAGVSQVEHTSTGAPSIPLPTASGSEFLWPRVYLNTTADLSGATEMVVTDANAAGTSITFNDAAGAPTGSIFLGVVNQSNDAEAWIAVTVTGSAADETGTGAPEIPLITASGVSQTTKTSTGAPSIPLITASGASEIIKTAVGVATIALITAAGVGVIEKTASGAPEIPLITASGTSEIAVTASGSPEIPLITASGTAEVILTGVGSPSIALITASGTSKQERSATGSPQIPLITAAGTSGSAAAKTGTGAPEIPLITAAGVSQTIKTSTGAVDIPLITASGTSEISVTAVGSPTIPLITAAGTSVLKRFGVGSPSVPLITASGTSETTVTAVGSPSIPLITAAGTSVQEHSSTGSPSVPLITAAGTGSIEGQISSTGAVSVPLITASGTATRILTSTGSPAIPLLTAAGTSTVTAIPDQTGTGAVSIPLPTASGSSFLHPKVYLNTTQTLVGATEMVVTAATSDGTSITFDDAEGAPTGSIWLAVENRNNSAVAWIGVTVGPKLFDENGTGAVSIPLITASGTEATTWTPPDVYVTGGAVSLDLPLLTTSGTGETEPNHGIGAVSIPLPTAAGTTALSRKESGAPSIPLITTAGSALSNKETTGAVTIPLITASGTGGPLFGTRGPSYCASVTFTPNLHFASSFLPDASYCVGFDSEPVYIKVCVGGDSFARINIDNSLHSRVTILPNLCGCVILGSGVSLSNIYANGTATIPLITASGLFEKTIATGAATVPLITTAGASSRTIKAESIRNDLGTGSAFHDHQVLENSLFLNHSGGFWPTDAFVGKYIRNQTKNTNISAITSNTSSQIYHDPLTGGTGSDWDVGDIYELGNYLAKIPLITASGKTAHVATGAVSVPLITTSGTADADLGGDSYTFSSVGTALITDTNSAQTVPAASASAGDLLLVCLAANSNSPSLFDTGGHWNVLARPAVGNSRVILYGRIATGDADDVATVTGLTAGVPQIAQMAAFTGNPWDPMTLNDIVNQLGVLNNDTSTTMDYGSIVNASVTKTLSLICSVKIINTGSEGPSGGPDEAGFTEVGYEFSNLGSFDIMMSWAYRYDSLTTNAWDAGSWADTTGSSLRTDSISLHLRSNDSGAP